MKTLMGILIGIGTAAAWAAGPDQKTWDTVAGKAATFLKSSQETGGGWSTAASPGVTGIALTGLLKSGQATVKDPACEKALKYIESLVNREHKHIAGKDPKVQLQNYVTSVNVMALVAANQAHKYEGVIGD